MEKVESRYYFPVFCFFTVLTMSFFMSLVILLINFGFVVDVLYSWPKSWVGAFSVAFPISLLVIPVVKKIVDRAFASKVASNT